MRVAGGARLRPRGKSVLRHLNDWILIPWAIGFSDRGLKVAVFFFFFSKKISLGSVDDKP